MLQRINLDQGWQFKQSSTLEDGIAKEYLPVAGFPTVSHIDLLHHGLIPDPYIDANELKCLWVNDADWTYQTTKVGPVALADGEKAVLVLEGLDTVVDVYFNDEHILFSKNMHISHRVDITHLVSDKNEPSTLELRFRAAPAFARTERQKIGYRGNKNPETDVHFGGPERLFLRKAQYHWGWDWGPAVNTCGPWKPIYIETFTSRVNDFLVTQQVAEDLKTAEIRISGSVEYVSGEVEVTIEVADPSGNIVKEDMVKTSDGLFTTTISLSDIQLWYPHTHGSQPLYTVKATLSSHSSKCLTIGLRRLRILQHPLKDVEGSSFLFEINNIRLFCGGSCWIPGDFMLPRMTRSRYEEWLLLAKHGNQIMIRVWGGGIIESDDFYDICDREGILVWQDFLFACGNYPASQDFIENIRVEAEQAVRRVGYHPSLVIWAGNNEDYMLADRWEWELDYSDEKGPWDKTNFPAREIYERVLPAIVEKLGGDVPYWRSSPYGGKFANDTTVGDAHIWDVWHGEMAPYQDYKRFTSRFVSEFGFESCPDIRTLHKAITAPNERHAQSRMFDIHDKGPRHQRLYGLYLTSNFRFRLNPLRDFIYSTQSLQAEAMSYAYNLWRREFRGEGRENCAGVLVWQLNDIWPGTSWALVDVDLHRKPSFYITKRALARVVVGMEREVTAVPSYITTSYQPEKAALEMWVVNGTVEAMDVLLTLSAWDIQTGEEVRLVTETEATAKRVSLAPNQTNEFGKIKIPQPERTVVVAYVDSVATGERLARWVSWPEPLKYVVWSPTLKVSATVENYGAATDTDIITLRTTAPVKGVVIFIPHEEGADAVFEDNYIDLVPGEDVRVKATGLKGRTVQMRWMCDWELEKGFEL